jgi:hypothetical protein
MDRIEDTEDEVDFRPRKPELRRYVDDRGVRGEGDRERRLDPVPDAPIAGIFEPEWLR